MYTVKFTSSFKKSYKLMKKRGLNVTLLDDVVDILRQGKILDETVIVRPHRDNMHILEYKICRLITQYAYYSLYNMQIIAPQSSKVA